MVSLRFLGLRRLWLQRRQRLPSRLTHLRQCCTLQLQPQLKLVLHRYYLCEPPLPVCCTYFLVLTTLEEVSPEGQIDYEKVQTGRDLVTIFTLVLEYFNIMEYIRCRKLFTSVNLH